VHGVRHDAGDLFGHVVDAGLLVPREVLPHADRHVVGLERVVRLAEPVLREPAEDEAVEDREAVGELELEVVVDGRDVVQELGALGVVGRERRRVEVHGLRQSGARDEVAAARHVHLLLQFDVRRAGFVRLVRLRHRLQFLLQALVGGAQRADALGEESLGVVEDLRRLAAQLALLRLVGRRVDQGDQRVADAAEEVGQRLRDLLADRRVGVARDEVALLLEHLLEPLAAPRAVGLLVRQVVVDVADQRLALEDLGGVARVLALDREAEPFGEVAVAGDGERAAEVDVVAAGEDLGQVGVAAAAAGDEDEEGRECDQGEHHSGSFHERRGAPRGRGAPRESLDRVTSAAWRQGRPSDPPSRRRRAGNDSRPPCTGS
jgi:hypothetical protein